MERERRRVREIVRENFVCVKRRKNVIFYTIAIGRIVFLGVHTTITARTKQTNKRRKQRTASKLLQLL